MNLLELRTKLINLSGRFDLVIDAPNNDYSDNGADVFINEGQKFLDRLATNKKSFGSHFRFLEIGQFAISFSQCRAIKEVWIGSTTERWQIYKKDLSDLISEYLTDLPSSRSTGSIEYYSPGITRIVPQDIQNASFESYIGWVDVPIGPAYEYNTVIFNVPTDEKVMVEIKGLFYSNELIEDTDQSHWSVNNPLLLIMSAQRQMEIFNRNTQGVNDWTNAIQTEITQLNLDLVEEVIAEVNQMEG